MVGLKIRKGKFEEGLEDPSRSLSSWVGEDCCKWWGVGCSNQTGNIIKLDLKSPFFCDLMSGDTSTDFSRPILKCSNSSLEHLNLSLNQLIGNVPHSLGYVKRLRNLQLYGSAFSSSIPLSIQNLSRLEILDPSVNMMNRTISELIGQLPELRLESAASLKKLLARYHD
ncbi:hypothetical protein CMV_012576 [Castanea mollissima]|uniref:Leucine-rich repeat-containing N-terminal plant-type domain-containing protein n=1 Tax=Castanea mollissima TaxID=60419 RepID=A0A8J4REI9_9ROSI|nr:hypothetical protein CMV_012576 [Castanea mollissima]